MNICKIKGHIINDMDGRCFSCEALEKPIVDSIKFAYKNIEDFQFSMGFELNESFKQGWHMARLTEKQIGIPS